MSWPSERAWRKLIANEEDAEDGASYEELDELLSVWEIDQSFPGDGLKNRTRYHRRRPGFPFSYPLRTNLEPETVRRVCERIRQLYQYLGDL